MKNLFLILMFVSLFQMGQASTFKLYPLEDSLFLGGIVGLNLTSLYIESVQPILTPTQISNLNSDTIIGVDRWVTGMLSANSAVASDVFMYTSVLLPLGLVFSAQGREEWLAHGIMYLEAALLNAGLTGLTKGLAGRPRPYVYHTAVDVSSKLSTGSVRSFFSGHTSSSFAGAAYLSTVFSLYYPDSPWRIPLIAGSFAVAATTGILRITAGKHFVTDVLVGAVVGTLSGWLVPLSHYQPDEGVVLSFNQGESSGMYIRVSF